VVQPSTSLKYEPSSNRSTFLPISCSQIGNCTARYSFQFKDSPSLPRRARCDVRHRASLRETRGNGRLSPPVSFGVRGSGFGGQGWGFGVRGSVFGVRGSVFGVRVSGFWFRVPGFGFRCSGFRFRGSEFSVRCSVLGVGRWVFGVWVERSRGWVYGLHVRAGSGVQGSGRLMRAWGVKGRPPT